MRPARLLPALAAVLLLGGCHEGNALPKFPGAGKPAAVPEEPERPHVLKANFVRRADKVCAKATKQLEAIFEEVSKNDAPREVIFTAYIEKAVVPTIRKSLRQLRRFTPPVGDEATVEAVFDGFQRVVDKLAKDPAAADSGKDPFARANKAAKAYGFKACSQ